MRPSSAYVGPESAVSCCRRRASLSVSRQAKIEPVPISFRGATVHRPHAPPLSTLSHYLSLSLFPLSPIIFHSPSVYLPFSFTLRHTHTHKDTQIHRNTNTVAAPQNRPSPPLPPPAPPRPAVSPGDHQMATLVSRRAALALPSPSQGTELVGSLREPSSESDRSGRSASDRGVLGQHGRSCTRRTTGALSSECRHCRTIPIGDK